MELHTAERQEHDARRDFNHALDMLAIATSPRAIARHKRRADVAASRIHHARQAITALSSVVIARVAELD